MYFPIFAFLTFPRAAPQRHSTGSVPPGVQLTDYLATINRFNIWNTGADINFDRIAHLAKLVFSTKGVIISLVDGHEQ